MQSSLYLLPDLPSEGFSLCQSCTLHGFALAALGCFCFCGWFGMGESFIAATKDGTWVHMDGPRGASRSSLCPTEEGLGNGFCSYFRGSVVTDHHQLNSPFRNLLAGRNKYKIRNCLHRSGPTGFELPDTCTCSLVGTWLFLGSGQVLGLE